MANMWGQDIGQVRKLAGQLKAKAAEIQGIMTLLTKELGEVNWQGPDAKKFREDWNGQCTSQLKAVVNTLNDASARANRNAQQQQDASNAH